MWCSHLPGFVGDFVTTGFNVGDSYYVLVVRDVGDSFVRPGFSSGRFSCFYFSLPEGYYWWCVVACEL